MCNISYRKIAIIMTKQITTVLIDLSGTLHIDNAIVPGAVQALNRYRLFTFLMLYVCTCIVYIHMRMCVYICAHKIYTGDFYSAISVKMARLDFKLLDKKMEIYFLFLFCTT